MGNIDIGERHPGIDSGLLAMLQMLAFLQIPADPDQILHERGAGSRRCLANLMVQRSGACCDILRVDGTLGLTADTHSVDVG